MCNPHLELFSAARGAAKSLFKILERKSNINALENTGTKPEKFRGDIVFDKLYFNYPSRPDVKVRRFNRSRSLYETYQLLYSFILLYCSLLDMCQHFMMYYVSKRPLRSCQLDFNNRKPSQSVLDSEARAHIFPGETKKEHRYSTFKKIFDKLTIALSTRRSSAMFTLMS